MDREPAIIGPRVSCSWQKLTSPNFEGAGTLKMTIVMHRMESQYDSAMHAGRIEVPVFATGSGWCRQTRTFAVG